MRSWTVCIALRAEVGLSSAAAVTNLWTCVLVCTVYLSFIRGCSHEEGSLHCVLVYILVLCFSGVSCVLVYTFVIHLCCHEEGSLHCLLVYLCSGVNCILVCILVCTCEVVDLLYLCVLFNEQWLIMKWEDNFAHNPTLVTGFSVGC